MSYVTQGNESGSQRTIAAIEVLRDVILSSAVFISSALSTLPFTPARFVPLLWYGTFGGVALYVISSFAIRILELENTWAKWIPSIMLALALFNIQSLVHECGHALAGTLLLEQPNIVIKIIPFFGGSTKFVPMIASAICHAFKAQQIFLIIAACGPLVALGFSYSLLKWGIKKLEVYPAIGRLAICAATIDILFHFHSAISALQIASTSLQYDFVAIRTLAGIHPLVCAFVIVGIAAFLAYRASTQIEVAPASL